MHHHACLDSESVSRAFLPPFAATPVPVAEVGQGHEGPQWPRQPVICNTVHDLWPDGQLPTDFGAHQTAMIPSVWALETKPGFSARASKVLN